MRPLVCRRHRPGGVQRLPRGPAGYCPSGRMGLLLRESGRREERGSPVCSTGDQLHLSGELCYRTAGCERDPMPTQVATRLQETQICCEYSEGTAPKTRHRSQCVCRQRGCAREVATAGQSSFSQLKLSENRRKQFFIANNAAHCMQRRRQRSPTVRMVG
jgi:hypothetical protein